MTIGPKSPAPSAQWQMGQEGRGPSGVLRVRVVGDSRIHSAVCGDQLGLHGLLFPPRQAHVHAHKDGEHDKGGECGPLDEEADHDRDESEVGAELATTPFLLARWK